ncbi:MAG: immunoglobulin domain-containing protein [Planctomycetes bacterium]|nr:immunoglobulin domain-containing protein [Planctomycetota bacterium]
MTVVPGAPVTFMVEATGAPPLMYQWRKEGQDLPGAMSASLRIESAGRLDQGSYDCRVSNDLGSAVSEAARLTVAAGRLVVSSSRSSLEAQATADLSVRLDTDGQDVVSVEGVMRLEPESLELDGGEAGIMPSVVFDMREVHELGPEQIHFVLGSTTGGCSSGDCDVVSIRVRALVDLQDVLAHVTFDCDLSETITREGFPILTECVESSEEGFIRGDCNGDGDTRSVTDAVFLLAFNFLGGEEPPCLAACDANGDGKVIGIVGDAVYVLGFNFLGGPPPLSPFPDCGPGQLAGDEALGCNRGPEGCD